MTTYKISPTDFISDFLRRRLTDPEARAEAAASQTFTATASQTDYVLTAGSTVSCITSVTVAGTAKTKWVDYFWDYQNNTVILGTGATVGQSVVVSYKYGSTHWINSNRAPAKLSDPGWPQISVFTVSNVGRRLGNYSAPVEGDAVFQIDVWCKTVSPYTIGTHSYSGEHLAEYLAYEVTLAFETYESDFLPILYNYIPIGLPRYMGFNEQYQCEHYIVEVGLSGLTMGKLEV